MPHDSGRIRKGVLTLATVGTHCILELYDCPPVLLNDEAYVKDALRESVACGLAELLHEVSHHFHPQGVTALALIAESHVAIHTWPEYGYAAVDVFTCGQTADPVRACDRLVTAFRAERHSLRKLARGSAVGDRVAAEAAAAGAVLPIGEV